MRSEIVNDEGEVSISPERNKAYLCKHKGDDSLYIVHCLGDVLCDHHPNGGQYEFLIIVVVEELGGSAEGMMGHVLGLSQITLIREFEGSVLLHY